MARPIKDGLDYFPIITDFFRQRSVRALRGRFGADGIAVYIYILCEIYGGKGYYVIIDDDFLDAAVCDLGIKMGALQQIIEFLVDRSLLTRILVGTDKFYTSADIQNTFQTVRRSAKRCVTVDAEIWLLKNSETLPFIQVRTPEYNSGINDAGSGVFHDFSEKNHGASGVFPRNNPQRKVKESKGKEREAVVVSDNGISMSEGKGSACADAAAAAQNKIISALSNAGCRVTAVLKSAAAQWLGEHSLDVILYAVAEAESCGNASRKYVEAILDRYKREKLLTVEDVRADAEAHKRRGKGFSDKDSSVYKSGGTDYSGLVQRMNEAYCCDYDGDID